MRIHILTALWKRPKITRICFEGIKRLGFKATTAISEESYIPLCEEYGINWVMCDNKPLGKKWNTGMNEALKHEWDYIMILGSDDIVSDSLIDMYKPYFGEYDMMGVDSCYFYYKGMVKKIQSKNMSVGAGRMLSRKIVEECRPLWDYVDKGLDGSCLKNVRANGYNELVLPLGGAVVLDIKSDTNIHSYDIIKGEYVDVSILDVFSEKEKELLE